MKPKLLSHVSRPLPQIGNPVAWLQRLNDCTSKLVVVGRGGNVLEILWGELWKGGDVTLACTRSYPLFSLWMIYANKTAGIDP